MQEETQTTARKSKQKPQWLLPVIVAGFFGVIGIITLFVNAATTTSSLWNGNIPSTVATSSDTQSVELGVKFQSKVAGKVTGIRFYKNALNTGAHTGSLWDSKGSLLASVTFKGESTSGWQTASFQQPINIAANVTYVVSYHASNGHYSYTSNYFNKAYTNGDLTAIADQSASTNQGASNGAIVGIGSKCLDDKWSSFTNGNTIWLYVCNGTAAQHWAIPGDGTIRLDNNKYCLDVAGKTAIAKERVVLHSCDSTATQQWTINSNGSIVNKTSNLCLDDKWGRTNNGNPIWLYVCNSTAAQHWAIPTAPSLSGSDANGNGVYTYSTATTFPTHALHAANYWVDLIFQTSLTQNAPKPAPPTTVTATQSQNSIAVKWSASITQNPIANYYVIRNDSKVATLGGTTLGYSDTKLTANTTYSYQVQAIDDQGQVSDVSPTATITYNVVPPTPTPTPTPVPTPTPTGPYKPDGPSGTWNLKFEDEFNGTTVDTSKWSYQSSAEGDWSNPTPRDNYPLGTGNLGNQQLEFDTPNNCSVSGGVLSLIAKPGNIISQNSNHYSWASCLVTTVPSYSFRYGYMETSAKFPADKGFWPAFWTWAAPNQNLDASGETDAFEYYSDNKANLYLTSHPGVGGECTYKMPFDPTAAFHTYGVDIESTGTTWYVDGKNVCSVGGTSPGSTNIILDNFVYSVIPPVSGSTGVSQFDYVRAWQR